MTSPQTTGMRQVERSCRVSAATVIPASEFTHNTLKLKSSEERASLACIAGDPDAGFRDVATTSGYAGLARERTVSANGSDDRIDRAATDSGVVPVFKESGVRRAVGRLLNAVCRETCELFCAAGQPDNCPISAVRTRSGFPPRLVRALS